MVGLFYDRLSDDLDELRNDRVSQAGKTVNPVGNPISHSTNPGCGYRPSVGPLRSTSRRFPRHFGEPLNLSVETPLASETIGVGYHSLGREDPDPFPLMGSAHGRRR